MHKKKAHFHEPLSYHRITITTGGSNTKCDKLFHHEKLSQAQFSHLLLKHEDP